MTDPIADYLTRIRNASRVGHKTVEIPSSKIKKEITRILHEKGYILSYKFMDEDVKSTIKIALKYHPVTKKPALKSLDRVSRPGLRRYASAATMPKVLNGLGIAIISTSKGIITDKEARDLNIGGEILCYIS
ncbi:MAG: 30S ribosomal protein S8 [Prevotellaceae bacterium]|jgi:small subunit ribosomal protein S8|nr:30S ribosomal protein S8 [Prevotellaceae bacterium]